MEGCVHGRVAVIDQILHDDKVQGKKRPDGAAA